jgi:hypothetical protein
MTRENSDYRKVALVSADLPLERQERQFFWELDKGRIKFFTNSMFIVAMAQHLMKKGDIDAEFYFSRDDGWHKIPVNDKGRFRVVVPELGLETDMRLKYW